MKFRNRFKLDTSQAQDRRGMGRIPGGGRAIGGYESDRVGSCDTFRGDI